jgi:hypothetical protein
MNRRIRTTIGLVSALALLAPGVATADETQPPPAYRPAVSFDFGPAPEPVPAPAPAPAVKSRAASKHKTRATTRKRRR